MNHFTNLGEIPYNDLRKILDDSKKRKNKRRNLGSLDFDKDSPF